MFTHTQGWKDCQELATLKDLKQSLADFKKPFGGMITESGSTYPQDILAMEVQSDCPHCENRGITYVPNGLDDVDGDFCSCIAGEILLFNTQQ